MSVQFKTYYRLWMNMLSTLLTSSNEEIYFEVMVSMSPVDFQTLKEPVPKGICADLRHFCELFL